MPTLADLLSTTDLDALRAAPTTTPAPEPAAPKPSGRRVSTTCTCEFREDGVRNDAGMIVHKGCGRPVPETSVLRGVNAKPVVIECGGGCGSRVTVAPRKKDKTDGRPRLVVCEPCARAISSGSTVTRLANPPKSAPVGVTITRPTYTRTTEEKPMRANIDTMTSAQLGEVLKSAARQEAAEGLPERCAEATEQRKTDERKQRKAKKAERKAQKAKGTLPEFTIHGVFVPALDVLAIEGMDEVPSPKVRSPYNKARYRMGEALLPKNDEPAAPACTWQMLVEDHERMLAILEQGEPPKRAADPKPEPEPVATAIDLTEPATEPAPTPDRKALIRALRDQGFTKAQAKVILSA